MVYRLQAPLELYDYPANQHGEPQARDDGGQGVSAILIDRIVQRFICLHYPIIEVGYIRIDTRIIGQCTLVAIGNDAA